MDVKEAIEKRKSIRGFHPKKVTDDVIDELIEAGRMAPTAHNLQPQRYLIIKDSETKVRAKENELFQQDYVYGAGVILLCLVDNSLFQDKFPNSPEHQKRMTEYGDVSIASAFIVLRAEELGLGSCYIGLLDRDATRKMFEIPVNYGIPYALAIGYPAIEGRERDRIPLDTFTVQFSF